MSTGVVGGQCDEEDVPSEVLVSDEATSTNQKSETDFEIDSDWLVTRFDVYIDSS